MIDVIMDNDGYGLCIMDAVMDVIMEVMMGMDNRCGNDEGGNRGDDRGGIMEEMMWIMNNGIM